MKSESYRIRMVLSNEGEFGIPAEIDLEMKRAIKAAMLSVAKRHEMPNFEVEFGDVLMEPKGII